MILPLIPYGPFSVHCLLEAVLFVSEVGGEAVNRGALHGRGDVGVDGRAAMHRAPDPQQIPQVGRQHRGAIVKSLKPVYTAPNEKAAKDWFEEFATEWGVRYSTIHL